MTFTYVPSDTTKPHVTLERLELGEEFAPWYVDVPIWRPLFLQYDKPAPPTRRQLWRARWVEAGARLSLAWDVLRGRHWCGPE